MNSRPLKIIIAGGGTGGHLFPGIAVAHDIIHRIPGSQVLFVNTGNDLERTVLTREGFAFECIQAGGFKRMGLARQVRSLVTLPLGVMQSVRILMKFGPDLVIGLGSYSAAPVLVAAWMLRLPVVLMEQNIIPGLTNRILYPLAKRVFVSFEHTQYPGSAGKVRVTGNPVRREILVANWDMGNSVQHDGALPFHILILGGSQGAHRLNTAVMDALTHLSQWRDQLTFVHQTGNADLKMVRNGYRDHGIQARVSAFFLDMGSLYHQADLVICRAGATTVAEVSAIGKPVIFIPFPYAADNHQELNARALETSGAAMVITEAHLSGKVLARRIKQLMEHPEQRRDMARRMKRHGRPFAAQAVVHQCMQLVHKYHYNSGKSGNITQCI